MSDPPRRKKGSYKIYNFKSEIFTIESLNITAALANDEAVKQ